LHDPAYKLPRARCLVLPRFAVVRFSFATETSPSCVLRRPLQHLSPDLAGHVATTNDALILFESCLTGRLNYVPRRPNDRERNQLICSDCVFIYEEKPSGIKRWTDGVTWSPSRILGNFLVYRELDKPFPPGEKKRATRKKDRRPVRPGEPLPRPDGTGEAYSPTTPQLTSFTATPAPSDAERQLIGSLVDSYGFKSNGLVRRSLRKSKRKR
jgi:Gti1/Pac2 family transcription factor